MLWVFYLVLVGNSKFAILEDDKHVNLHLHVGKIDCIIHGWVLKQQYLQIGTEFKINFYALYSRINFNCSLKSVLHFAKTSTKWGLLLAKWRIVLWLTYSAPCYSCTGFQINTVFENSYISMFNMHLILILSFHCYPLSDFTQDPRLYPYYVPVTISYHWSWKAVILLEQTYHLNLCGINLFRSFSKIR